VGDGKVAVGDLVCTCEAGTFGRECYRTAEARAFETADTRRSDLNRSVDLIGVLG
jgi:hypothetical protein